ncbi:unnamed protein product [Arctia plantaginis]|uniref:Major facilitator superfamily (MFS) profile domain-containing protein n=1 Tax=Arctia plantaginis TaxID=874455 RepID=A0A8S1AG77_ARCPL|nr:unnamed protein product [Arctia plantaginis]
MQDENIMPHKLNLDKILVDIGNYGVYQIVVMGYLIANVLSIAIKNNQYVFAAGPVEYRCKVPQCETSPPKFEAGPWASFALPGKGKCHRYVPLQTSACKADSFSNKTEPCYSWVYANNDTISYDFNLACQEWKRTMVGTLRSVAYFATMPVISFCSDTFGRRSVLIFTAVAPAFIGTWRAFCQSYLMYMTLEFIDAFLGSGGYSTIFILALEMVNLKNRTIGGTVLSTMYAIGLALLGVSAWLIPSWRTRTIVLYAPGVIFIAYIWTIDESVRWLISKGRNKEAANSILKAARMNKRRLSVNTEATLKHFAESEDGTGPNQSLKDTKNEPATSKKPLYKRVLKSKVIMCRILVVSFWWVTTTMVYYGLTINSVSLAGNIYLNFCVTSLIEIPGYVVSLATLNRFGRKSSIMTAFLLSGISLLLIGTATNHTTIIMLSMFGKLCISMSYCSIYIYTVELFPTEARHQLMGVCSMLGRVGNMIAPQTPLLVHYMESLPYILFGTMSAVSGFLMLLTPETLKLKLPDTFEEAENMNIIPRTSKRVDILSAIDEGE